MKTSTNADPTVVSGFGKEWERFDQSRLSVAEQERIFEQYFSIFPWSRITSGARGFDLGCGTGRWARFVAPRVGELHCIDPSIALTVARRNLASTPNVCFHSADVDNISLPDESMDFGYCLGVLHHVPDTARGIRSCVQKLKPGAPFLLYLYYNFEDRPLWFRLLWQSSDLIRRCVSRLPFPLKVCIAEVLAVLVYWPLARTAALGERLALSVDSWPLNSYRNRSFYVMRNDSLDRFGTKVEKRFARKEIQFMMEAGLDNILFSPTVPFWSAVGYKKLKGVFEQLDKNEPIQSSS